VLGWDIGSTVTIGSNSGQEAMNTQHATGLHLRQLFNLLRRRWKLITTAGVVAVGLAGTIGLVLPPRYTANAQVIIDPQRGSNARGRPGAAGVFDDAAVQTHVSALISNSHLQRVLDSLLAERGPGPTKQPDRDVGDLSMETLKQNINAFKEVHSRVIGITYTSSSPAFAAAVANRAVELYLTALTERNRADRNAALNSLNERIPSVRAEVARADAALQNYRIKHGFTDANRTDMVDQQLVELNRQLAVARSDLAERDARITTLRELQRSDNGTTLPINALNDPTLGELYREEAALLSRSDNATHPSERDPKLTSASSHLQELRVRIDQTIDQTLSRLAAEKGILETRVRHLQRSIAILQDASTEAREPEMHLRELQRQATAFAQLYESLLQRQKEIIEDTDVQPDVRVLSFAPIPDRPSSPNPILFILPAMVVASIGAGLLTVLLEWLDGTLRTERDVTDALGISCIGLIPQLTGLSKIRPHQLLPKNAQYTEAIRSVVATALQLTNPQKSSKVFLVTSSVPGEGKTTLAISFAVYAALLQRRVLLVDLAFRHPSIASELEDPADGDISHVLQGRPLAELIRGAPDLGIDYLPLSRDPVDPVAMLGNERVPELLRQLKESYDCVVIDSGPLLSATEARLLASMVDQVLFAVKWGSTRREVVQNALRLLGRFAFGANDLRDVTSAVVTQVNLKRHALYRHGDSCENLLRVKPSAA
jgi:polysaccharide biosynthesis transport protein